MFLFKAKHIYRLVKCTARMAHDKKSSKASAIKSKGKGDEEIYFNKKEKEQINLLSNLQDDAGELELAVENDKRIRSKLFEALDKHNIKISEPLVHDIMNWKNEI